MTSIKDKLKAARRAERIVPICLRGDLAAEFDKVKRDLDQLPQEDASLAAGGRRRELREQLEEIRAEMLESTVDFRIQAIPRTRWTELAIQHPARPDVITDKSIGVNEDEFIPALLREGLVSPVLDDEDWEALDAALTRAQFLELGNAAWEVNQQRVSVPFLPPASPNQRSSASG